MLVPLKLSVVVRIEIKAVICLLWIFSAIHTAGDVTIPKHHHLIQRLIIIIVFLDILPFIIIWTFYRGCLILIS